MNFRAVDEARAIAEELGATVSQVSLAWLLGAWGVTAPIVGPRTLEQLEDLLGAAELRLSHDHWQRLDAPTRPVADYPERMLSEQLGLGDLGGLVRRRGEAVTAS